MLKNIIKSKSGKALLFITSTLLASPICSAGRHSTWTSVEDAELIRLVQLYGTENWVKIAAAMNTGKTRKQCRARWTQCLASGINKDSWTPDEDALLMQLFQRFGNKWAKIAAAMKNGRTDHQCRKRYLHLAPLLQQPPPRRQAHLVDFPSSPTLSRTPNPFPKISQKLLPIKKRELSLEFNKVSFCDS
jgi:hypothetical protein